DTFRTPVEGGSRRRRKAGSRCVLTSSPSGPKSPYPGSDTSWWREDGTDARAFLAKAAATFTVLSLIPVALSGSAPSHASPVLRPISDSDGGSAPVGDLPWPAGLFEIRSEMARVVTIELPASATNISLTSAKGFARASTVSFTIEGGEARLFLGTGSFNVTGRRVLAEMASPDLLVFKSVPTASTNEAGWRAVLDAISAGQVVAELDLVATSDGHWMENPARYRIDVAAWPLAVRPRAASAQVDSLRSGGAIILFAFDPNTMPTDGSDQISVTAR